MCFATPIIPDPPAAAVALTVQAPHPPKPCSGHHGARQHWHYRPLPSTAVKGVPLTWDSMASHGVACHGNHGIAWHCIALHGRPLLSIGPPLLCMAHCGPLPSISVPSSNVHCCWHCCLLPTAIDKNGCQRHTENDKEGLHDNTPKEQH